MNEIIPEEIGKAKVLRSIKLDDKSKLLGTFERNGVIESVVGLAICKSNNEAGYYLFGCNDQWKSIIDTWHETIDDAIDQAEFDYPGTSNNWIVKE